MIAKRLIPTKFDFKPLRLLRQLRGFFVGSNTHSADGRFLLPQNVGDLGCPYGSGLNG